MGAFFRNKRYRTLAAMLLAACIVMGSGWQTAVRAEGGEPPIPQETAVDSSGDEVTPLHSDSAAGLSGDEEDSADITSDNPSAPTSSEEDDGDKSSDPALSENDDDVTATTPMNPILPEDEKIETVSSDLVLDLSSHKLTITAAQIREAENAANGNAPTIQDEIQKLRISEDALQLKYGNAVLIQSFHFAEDGCVALVGLDTATNNLAGLLYNATDDTRSFSLTVLGEDNQPLELITDGGQSTEADFPVLGYSSTEFTAEVVWPAQADSEAVSQFTIKPEGSYGDTFFFKISNSANTVCFYDALQAGESRIIQGLPDGDYTIAEFEAVGYKPHNPYKLTVKDGVAEWNDQPEPTLVFANIFVGKPFQYENTTLEIPLD